MNAYLDTSVLASMFAPDVHSGRLEEWLPRAAGRLALSHWTLAEFTSVLARSARVGRLTITERERTEAALDDWTARQSAVYAVVSADVTEARELIRSGRYPLRAPDALHLVVARRRGASLATFDEAMRRAALDLGIQVEAI